MSGELQNLESRNWVASGNVNFSLDSLKPQSRIRNITLTFDLQFTKNAADTLSGDLFPLLVQNIKVGSYVNIGGPALFRLMHAINGHVVEDPATNYSIVSTSATSGNLFFSLDVPFCDPRQPSSDDGSLPSELLVGRGLEISTSSAAVWGVGALQIVSGTIRCAVHRVNETNVPQLTRIGYVDAPSQTIRLDAGAYKDLIIVRADGSPLAAGDITSIDMIADGAPVLQNVRQEQLIYWWNRTSARNTAAAAGVPGRGELVKGAALFLPLCFHDNSGKSNLTKQMIAHDSVLIQLNGGSLINPRLVYWKAVAKDTASIQQIAQTVGAPPDATTYEPATTSKTPPHGVGDGKPPTKKTTSQFAFLAGKFRRTPTPGNKLKA